MSDYICKETMTRCLTPGMCSPHGGCQPKKEIGMGHIDLGQFVDWVWNLKAERDQIKAENAGLKTGYEAYEAQNAALKGEVEALRKHQPSAKVIWCACGDGRAANSYGAGFMDANGGVCENCDAASGGFDLRKDAERYRLLGSMNGRQLLDYATTARCGAGLAELLDAALGQGEQS